MAEVVRLSVGDVVAKVKAFKEEYEGIMLGTGDTSINAIGKHHHRVSHWVMNELLPWLEDNQKELGEV